MSVLVLGAGMVSGPVFEYLHQHNTPFSVVSCVERELEVVRRNFPDAQCHCLSIDHPQVPTLIARHQLVINLVPLTLLSQVADLCISERRNMLCASYASEEFRQRVHKRAEDADIIVFCECGLDPGIDHMLTMRCVDLITADKGQITSYTSWCGGIPAPDSKDNPLQYKFSWNPKTALMSSCREAGFLKDGKAVNVVGKDTMNLVSAVDTSWFLPGMEFEGYPNKYLPSHVQGYGLEATPDFFRGTLRYKGFCDAVQGLMLVGLFSQDPIPPLAPDAGALTWRSLVSYLITGSVTADNLENALLEQLENSASRLEVLKGLGLLSDAIVEKQSSPFDTLAAHLQTALAYGPGERDMIVMQNEIGHRCQGQGEQLTRIGLVVTGDQGGHSAMAKTVGYPVGIVARMILEGEIRQRGVVLPTTADIYQPVLSALAELGICAQVTTDAV